jgi:exodeoxyribonuclease V alpha subunit
MLTDSKSTVSAVEKKLSIKLAAEQKMAVEQAIKAKVMVITGGPGTGKTTIINTILTILKSEQISIKLCAPTGRAAKRLAESTGLVAMTIHRLLETDPAHGGFKRNEECPLECDYIVIDETSMVDVALFYALLKAIPPKAALLMVGDVDQLPSVGAGQVLADIIASGTVAVVRLTEIFRQAASSNIVASAHLVNKGWVPDLTHKQNSDFYFIAGKEEKDLSKDIMQKLLLIVQERIPAKFGLDPLRDIQVLCPTQRGGLGVRSMNIELQKALNPSKNSIVKFGQNFAVGDKVMQMENNHDSEVYNGDIGFIRSIDEQEQIVEISFDGHEVAYSYTDLDQISLAYATTIHKSQGSEYPAVVIPLTMQSFMMLKRNLIYTAITRGKKLVVMLGQKKALIMAIKNIKGSKRYTKLKEWIQED